MACLITPDNAAFASSLIAYTDCQAQAIGQQGYTALATAGSAVSQFITVLLTILVAVVGYRLLLGETITLRESVMTVVKIGFVVTFATGWPAYRSVIYDVAVSAPEELGAMIGGATALPGSYNDLATHLDATDQQFERLAIDNVSHTSIQPPPGTVPPPLFPGFDVFALGGARVIFLIGAVGSYAATRLAAGLLLALGPLFIGFFLFDTLRGLTEGWVKVLAGVVLGTLATSIVLGVELTLLEPWLAKLIAIRDADQGIPGAGAQLLATTTIFAFSLLVAVSAVAKAAWSFRIPNIIREARAPFSSNSPEASRTQVHSRLEANMVSAPPRSRAYMLADSINAHDRREKHMLETMTSNVGSSGARPFSGTSSGQSNGEIGLGTPAADTRRRVGRRVSTSAQRRDAPQ